VEDSERVAAEKAAAEKAAEKAAEERTAEEKAVADQRKAAVERLEAARHALAAEKAAEVERKEADEAFAAKMAARAAKMIVGEVHVNDGDLHRRTPMGAVPLASLTSPLPERPPVAPAPDVPAGAATAPPQVLPTPATATVLARAGSISSIDAHLVMFAAQMGLSPPVGETWLSQLRSLCNQLPYAIVVGDMKAPRAPPVNANAARELLVGDSEAEQLGQNCRFLQGPLTQPPSVRVLCKAMEVAKQTTVRITNYKKNGDTFSNVLTLHPVHDSSGAYRYTIGVQSDEKMQQFEGAALEQLRRLLPTVFDVALQPTAFGSGGRRCSRESTSEEEEATRKRWLGALTKFTRLIWSLDFKRSLDALAVSTDHVKGFGSWLTTVAPADALTLELMVVVAVLLQQPQHLQGAAAIQLCRRYLDREFEDRQWRDALAELKAAHAGALEALSSTTFQEFVKKNVCVPLIESVFNNNMTNLLWSDYTLPTDARPWVLPLVAIAESYPLGLVLSDTTILGNPMVYVNREFVRMSGYSKDEVLGRDCRFLQGPETEPNSVAVIQDALRSGGDCHVKITNYRKNGEAFDNLLTLHGIHDTNEVFRFCLGLQLDVTGGESLKKRLMILSKLLKLVPREF